MSQESPYAVTDPATGQVHARFPLATVDQIEDALVRASARFRAWRTEDDRESRTAALARLADLHEQRRHELAAIIGREMGKPLDQALIEVDFCADIYRYHAEHAAAALADQPIELAAGSPGSALLRKAPYGVLLGIMPWNFPYYQVARFAAPNLAVGNPILLKHAPQCPESATVLEELFLAAGFAEGAYRNLYLSNDQAGEVIADARVAGVSLTGSERAGAAVAEIAGRHLKKVVLELGGSDPFLVLDAEDLDAVVADAVAARVDNAGQVCNAAKRFIVAEHLYADFLERFTAQILAAGEELGPLSSEAAARTLGEQVDHAVAEGAEFVGAGRREGAYFPAGVLTGVRPEHEAYRSEFFGPVAMVFSAADEAEAVEIANDTPYGLGAYVYTTDPDQAARVADGLHCGMVFVNGALLDSAELPFGGVGRSGFGRELGIAGMAEFVNVKMIRVAC